MSTFPPLQIFWNSSISNEIIIHLEPVININREINFNTVTIPQTPYHKVNFNRSPARILQGSSIYNENVIYLEPFTVTTQTTYLKVKKDSTVTTLYYPLPLKIIAETRPNYCVSTYSQNSKV